MCEEGEGVGGGETQGDFVLSVTQEIGCLNWSNLCSTF